jgi:hypothetical protein
MQRQTDFKEFIYGSAAPYALFTASEEAAQKALELCQSENGGLKLSL